MSRNLLGVDFGTTSLKACLFNEKGERLAKESVEYTLITEGERVEFPAEDFFKAFIEVFDKINSKFKIEALAIDTQGETLIVLDKEGKPLMNAISWLDNRGEKQAKEMEEKFGVEYVYNLTGQAEIPAGYPLPKIKWLKDNKPEIFNKADKFLLLEDYIIYKLTGNFKASRSLYSSSLVLNIHTGEYIKEFLDFASISEKNLPTLIESGELVGEYKGVKIVSSALDQIAGITGAGLVKEGIISETTGTALAVCALTAKFPKYYEGLKVSSYYVRKGVYCLLMWAPTAGATLNWFKRTFCENMSFEDMNKLADSIEFGSEGLICLPHLCGTVMPENNPLVKGCFSGITLKHTKGHFIKAIQESIAYNIKEFVDFIGVDVKEIRSMGGGAKSPVWCDIKSAVSGKKVITLKEGETACLGSAIFAGLGIGAFGSLDEASKEVVILDKTYSADEKMKESYAKIFADYKEKEKKIMEIYK